MEHWKSVLWGQFGAAIDMLENALRACPDEVWGDRDRRPEFWMMAHHTLFYLDMYLSETEVGFAPPEPFGMDETEWDPPRREHPYEKADCLRHLEHCRAKCRAAMEALTEEGAQRRCGFSRLNLSVVELHLYNMRHVQHHTAQLNLILRQAIDAAPPWVSRAGGEPASFTS